MASGRCMARRGGVIVTGRRLACCGGVGSMLACRSEALGDIASRVASCGSNGWATWWA